MNWGIIVFVVVASSLLLGGIFFLANRGGKLLSGGAVAIEPAGGRPTAVPPEPTPLAPPQIPSPKEGVDPGSAPWKAPAQWSMIGMGILLVLALFADTYQKVQGRGHERRKAPKWFIWIALVATILGIIYVIWSDATIIKALTPTGHYSVAVLIACALWAIAFSATKDPSYPAFGVATVAVLYLLYADKSTGALAALIGFPDSVMYNFDGVIRLISNNQMELAKFSITIYIMLAFAFLLCWQQYRVCWFWPLEILFFKIKRILFFN